KSGKPAPAAPAAVGKVSISDGTLPTAQPAAPLPAAPAPAPAPATPAPPPAAIVVQEPVVDLVTPAPALPRHWLGADYLLWFYRGQNVPASLVSTGSAASQGVLNAGGTSLLGPGRLDYGLFNGFRLKGGVYLNDEGSVGIMAEGFLLG